MSGAVLLFTPLSIPLIVHGLYLYIFVIVLYCVWSTLAFLDLAQVENGGRNRIWLWSGLVLLVPLLGGATYLLLARSTISRHTVFPAPQVLMPVPPTPVRDISKNTAVIGQEFQDLTAVHLRQHPGSTQNRDGTVGPESIQSAIGAMFGRRHVTHSSA